MTDTDAAHRAHLPGARRGGVRRVDQRGGDAPLVAGRARLGDAARPRSTCASAAPCASSCATRTRTSSTAAAARYTEIEPPTRLAFTWIWDGDTRRTLIEIDFEEADGATTVRFTHSGLWDEEAVRSHEGGWGKVFDNLATFLEAE